MLRCCSKNQRRGHTDLLWVMQDRLKGLKVSVLASLTLAFASMGDSFLYPFLPINAGKVGIPVIWVGLLLSINRFIRLFTNQLLVQLIRKFSLKTATILAVFLSILSTAGYGIGFGITGWILLRVLWGVSFSILRTSMLTYGLMHHKAGLSLGISRGIYEAGPLIALFLGPFLLEKFEVSVVFILLTLLSLPAFGFALYLPDVRLPSSPKRQFIIRVPSLFNGITFLTSLLAEGMIVVVLGILLKSYYTDWELTEVTALAASYLALRRMIFMIFSPSGGFLADKIGFEAIFVWSVVFIILGLILLLFNFVPAGLIIIFIFNSINNAVAPGRATATEKDVVVAIAENATWRDAGAALGALAGGFLLNTLYLISCLSVFTLVLIIILFIYLKRKYFHSKIMYYGIK